jgi:hypothetical protein
MQYKIPIMDLEEKGIKPKIGADVAIQVNDDKIVDTVITRVEEDFVIVSENTGGETNEAGRSKKTEGSDR